MNMNRHRTTSCIVALMVLLTVMPSLFAKGAKEVGPEEIVGKVISVDETKGTWDILVRNEAGIEYIFRAPSDNTDFAYPPQNLRAGDYVAMTSNGIMTASLPGQTTAVQIRLLNPLVALGALEVSVPRTHLAEPVVLEDQFSYSYGYFLYSTIRAQQIYPYADYFARGAFDAASGTQPLMAVEEMYTALDDYQYNVLAMGLAVDTIGSDVETVDALQNLAAPSNLIEKFSYGYGYLLTATALSQGFELNATYLSGGMIDAAYTDGLYTEQQMQDILVEYTQKLSEELEAMIAQLAADNLAEAEAFLEQNATVAGVQTTANGLQYQIKKMGSGVIPTTEDTVLTNYELTLLDGTVIDSTYQRGSAIALSPTQVIPAMTEALTMMPVGTSMRIWVHPYLGYGEAGAQVIEPNSLLIFDIETISIVE